MNWKFRVLFDSLMQCLEEGSDRPRECPDAALLCGCTELDADTHSLSASLILLLRLSRIAGRVAHASDRYTDLLCLLRFVLGWHAIHTDLMARWDSADIDHECGDARKHVATAVTRIRSTAIPRLPPLGGRPVASHGDSSW